MHTTPDHGRVDRTPARSVAIVAAIMLGATVGTYLLWRRDRSVVLEHHLIEWSQAVLLLIACAIHGARARLRAESLDSVCRTGLALFCFSLAVRETDIDLLGESPRWEVAEYVVRVIIVALWIAFAISLRHRFGWMWSKRRAAMRSMCAAYSAAGVGLYLSSFLFDKYIIPVSRNVSRLAEETIQLNACILFLAAAVATRTIGRERVSG